MTICGGRGGPVMTLTEEQREAIRDVSDLPRAIGCTQCHSYIQEHYGNQFAILRAMIDSSDHIVEPDELIGFDLEKVREAVHTLENFAFASGKITAGQIQDVLWGARLLAASAAEIERLRGYEIAARDLSADITKVAGDRDDQAARIQELEDAHKRSGVKYAKIINELRSSVYANIPGLKKQWDEILNAPANGKIGPDARPKCDHAWQAAIEERGYQTCLKCGECRNIEDIPRTAPAWQITDERKAVILHCKRMLTFLKEDDAPCYDVEKITKDESVLVAMLEEAGRNETC